MRVKKRMREKVGCVVSSCAALLFAVSGCGGKPNPESAPAAEGEARRAVPVAPAVPSKQSAQAAQLTQAAPSRLPEDPIAGKRSEEQWREHLEEEERERQLGYDRRRLKQHRAVVRLIAAARAQYDRARTEAVLAKARERMPKRLEELRRQTEAIDHWGVSSRMLGDYQAVAALLADTYPEAKRAALQGDAPALERARADFDQRMETIAAKLEEAAESKEEYE